MKEYFVYIMTSDQGELYIGITSNLLGRTQAHQRGEGSLYTREHHINKLIYAETYDNPLQAIAREKQLKKWSRKKKIILIERMNPSWRDLYEDMINF